LENQPKYSVPKDPSKKTGLGSSAALTVSLLAACLQYLGLPTSDGESYSKEFHCHCQLLNAFLQNKVGSGFDIAASIYGSQLFRRFSNTDILKERLVPFLTSLYS
jgi:phosphomevalonate kinase